MTWVDLGVPRPREAVAPYIPVQWPNGQVITLPVPQEIKSMSLCDVVSSRRSRRVFKDVVLERLSDLLWLSCRCCWEEPSNLGFALEWRPVASAGAIHPIHVLLFNATEQNMLRYSSASHVLIEVIGAKKLLDALRVEVDRVLLMQGGWVIMFVAEPGKTFAKYTEASSLIWRDAGVLLGHMHLVAESLGLNFCPLGITGEPIVSQLEQQGRLIGVGMALIGARE